MLKYYECIVKLCTYEYKQLCTYEIPASVYVISTICMIGDSSNSSSGDGSNTGILAVIIGGIVAVIVVVIIVIIVCIVVCCKRKGIALSNRISFHCLLHTYTYVDPNDYIKETFQRYVCTVNM